MKVKTITCHEVYNHGATLQEYALLSFLNESGYDAEGIHYKPPYLSQHFNFKKVGNPKYDKPLLKQLYYLAKLPNRLKSLQRKRAFDTFHQKYIPTTSLKYTNNMELRNNLPDADVFICGSDQIWNSFFQNGKDPAFYLNFVPDNKNKISYAASFAIEQLEESIKPFVKENVSRLNSISVRETSGLQILNDLGIKNATQVLDPVFLLDAQYWKSKFISPINEEFILIYDSDTNPLIKSIAEKIKKSKGYKIITLDKNIKYADHNFYLEGPEKFLSLVANSKITLTNSFHATAFSLIFERDVIVFNRFENINTRMRDLLALFNLNDYLISSIENYHKLKPIDYKKLQPKITKHVNKSKKFLIKALNE